MENIKLLPYASDAENKLLNYKLPYYETKGIKKKYYKELDAIVFDYEYFFEDNKLIIATFINFKYIDLILLYFVEKHNIHLKYGDNCKWCCCFFFIYEFTIVKNEMTDIATATVIQT